MTFLTVSKNMEWITRHTCWPVFQGCISFLSITNASGILNEVFLLAEQNLEVVFSTVRAEDKIRPIRLSPQQPTICNRFVHTYAAHYQFITQTFWWFLSTHISLCKKMHACSPKCWNIPLMLWVVGWATHNVCHTEHEGCFWGFNCCGNKTLSKTVVLSFLVPSTEAGVLAVVLNT